MAPGRAAAVGGGGLPGYGPSRRSYLAYAGAVGRGERGAGSRHLAWAPDPDLPPGGFVVIRADGRVRFAQTFAGIIERQRETLRAETAGQLWGD